MQMQRAMNGLRTTALTLTAVFSLYFLLGYGTQVVTLHIIGPPEFSLGDLASQIACPRVKVFRLWEDATHLGRRRVVLWASADPAGIVEWSFPSWPVALGAAGVVIYAVSTIISRSETQMG